MRTPHSLLRLWPAALILCCSLVYQASCILRTFSPPRVHYVHEHKARQEVFAFKLPAPTDRSFNDTLHTLWRIENRLRTPAKTICRMEKLPRKKCIYSVTFINSSESNAISFPEGAIFLFGGLAKYLHSEDELAYIVAHEIAHVVTSHSKELLENRYRAGMLAAILGGALSAFAEANSRSTYSYQSSQSEIEAYYYLGAAAANVTFNKDQEREADYLAAYMIHYAGYSLKKARNAVRIVAKLSSKFDTGFASTHPAGNERLAAFDLTIRELQSSRDPKPRM